MKRRRRMHRKRDRQRLMTHRLRLSRPKTGPGGAYQWVTEILSTGDLRHL
ncbi:hypothetical protein ACVWWO_000968 [Bradyrhizobium sp. F1.13.1]